MNKKAVVFFSLLGFASLAKAIAPIVWALGASASLVFGLIFGSWLVESKTTAGDTITVVGQLDATLTESAITADYRKLPSSSGTIYFNGPYSFLISNGSKQYSVSGSTLAEIRESLALCPSDICTNSSTAGNGTFASGASGGGTVGYVARNIGSLSSILTQTAPTDVYDTSTCCMVLRASTPGGFAYLNFTGFTKYCAAGYTFNSSTRKCDLSSIPEAQTSAGDGVCALMGGVPSPSDPDCKKLIDDKRMTRSTAADGTPVTTVQDKNSNLVSHQTKLDGTSVVSQVFNSSDGGKRREDTVVSSNGTIGETSITNYPSNPPPLYPGDTGSSVPGTSGNTQTAAPCGGSGQPACTTTSPGLESKLDSIKSGQCGGPGQPACKVTFDSETGSGEVPGSSLPDSLTGPLDSLSDNSIIPTSSYCPADMFSFTLPLPASAGGPMHLSDQGIFCDAMGQYQELIRTLSIAAGLIAATFIFLRA